MSDLCHLSITVTYLFLLIVILTSVSLIQNNLSIIKNYSEFTDVSRRICFFLDDIFIVLES